MMEERIFGSDSKESGDKIDRFDFAPALILLQTIWKLPITIRPVVGARMGINHSRPFFFIKAGPGFPGSNGGRSPHRVAQAIF